MWKHRSFYSGGKRVWFFTGKEKYTNLSRDNRFMYKACKTQMRKLWESSGNSVRIAPDTLGEWQ